MSKKVLEKDSERVIVGTEMYMAPEIFDQEGDESPYGTSCDIWAVGILMYFMNSGHYPFFGFEIKDQIRFDYLKFKEPCWEHVTNEAKNVIELLLTKEPLMRVTAEQILKHKWFDPIHATRNEELKTIKVDSEVIKSIMKYKSMSKLKKTAMSMLVKQLQPKHYTELYNQF